ncbi:MAG: beta-mannosidase [Bacteroidaceae bacterium]|nr:beta-mannosidase [Bacteroidaceae bacterium]MBR3529891.1 beta-mannosidase [Bacteroidaceae bacterium]
MKSRTLLIIASLLLMCGTIQARTDKSAKSPAQQLKERLAKLQKRGIMYGHHDDPFYGLGWEWDEGRSDTYALVGDYPGVMSFDLGGIEMGDDKNLDSVPFNRIREEIVKQHERGGIITISWHLRNPLLGTTAWIESDAKAYDEALPYLRKIKQVDKIPAPHNTVKSILPGGSQHTKFLTWLQRVSDFLFTLKDSKGNPIPFIFRPWHEYNGGWFWWGKGRCTDEEFKQLWILTQDYINRTLSDVIVWSCSPNLGVVPQEFYSRWPGDERVDLLGLDAYQWGTEADYIQQCSADLDFLEDYAQQNGLLFAMTECGYKNSPDATWWSRVLRPMMDKHHLCYFLAWRNAQHEHFGCAPGLATADDFKQMAKWKTTLFVKDIKKVK